MRSAFALRIFSGKNIYNFAILENLRIFQNCLFTGGVVKANGICSAAFCESTTLRLASSPSQSPTVTALPKGEPLAVPANFISLPRPLPLGEVDLRSKDGEGEDACGVHPQFFPSPAMIHPTQPYAVRERCRNFVRRQKGGKQTECRFWGGKVVRFADFDRTFAKDSPPRY